jgi:hypothetical protein
MPSQSRPVASADMAQVERRLRASGDAVPPRIEISGPPRWSVATRAFFDDQGGLWVRNASNADRGSVWTAFNRAGQVRLHFTLPPRFDLRAVRGNTLYGVGYTENDAQTVRLYRLSAGG